MVVANERIRGNTAMLGHACICSHPSLSLPWCMHGMKGSTMCVAQSGLQGGLRNKAGDGWGLDLEEAGPLPTGNGVPVWPT